MPAWLPLDSPFDSGLSFSVHYIWPSDILLLCIEDLTNLLLIYGVMLIGCQRYTLPNSFLPKIPYKLCSDNSACGVAYNEKPIHSPCCVTRRAMLGKQKFLHLGHGNCTTLEATITLIGDDLICLPNIARRVIYMVIIAQVLLSSLFQGIIVLLIQNFTQ